MTSAMTSETLKSCPFCGGEASKRLFYKGKYRVHCNVCDAHSGDVCDTEAEAIAAWNARADDKRIAELEHQVATRDESIHNLMVLLDKVQKERRELESLVRDMQALDRMHHGPFSWERFDKMQDMRESINARLIKMGFVEEVGK